MVARSINPPSMKTYYYLATVLNATSPAVRVQTATKARIDAFAQASIALANSHFHVSSMQELTMEQYYAPNVAPVWCDVQVRGW
jgi:hypothetical protein